MLGRDEAREARSQTCSVVSSRCSHNVRQMRRSRSVNRPSTSSAGTAPGRRGEEAVMTCSTSRGPPTPGWERLGAGGSAPPTSASQGRRTRRHHGRRSRRRGTRRRHSVVLASTHEQLVATPLLGPPGVGTCHIPSLSCPTRDGRWHRPGPKREGVQVLATDHQAAGDLVGAEVAEVIRAHVGLGVAGEHPGVFGRDVEVHLIAGVRRRGLGEVAGSWPRCWWAKVSDRR